MKMFKEVVVALAVAVLVFSPALAGQARPPRQLPPGFPDLVGALKATPGCLGVEAARTMSGKQVIFAWFENKKAVLNWYYSDTHLAVMNQFFPQRPPRTPLANLPDDDDPILAIASLTMAEKPQTDLTSLPVSQLAIELYRPLPGGLALGGRFAPAALNVPGLHDVPLSAGKTDK